MKTLEKFLDELADRDVKLWVENERLRCNAPEGVLTSDIRIQLSDRKQEILTFLQQANLKRDSKQNQIQPIERNGNPLPLSYAQQRLWFIEKMALSSNAYNMPLTLHLVGQLNHVALEKSINQIIARHETLRTTFSEINGTPVQIIKPSFELQLPLQDLSKLAPSAQKTKLQQLLQQENELSFNLEVDHPIRAQLFQLGITEHILQITLHHIASDGWSLTVLPKELSAIYSAALAEKPSPLPELPIQYADYAVWQRDYLQGETLETQLSYWKQKLGNLPQLQLPTDHPRPPIQTFNGEDISITIPVELTSKLRKLTQQQGVTLFMTLLAAFKVLLSRYSGQESIIVGTPIANRNRSEIEGSIGFFVNSLVMYTDLGGDCSFTEVLNRVKQTALEAYSHQDIPFEKLVEQLQPQRSLSQNPLFQVMFGVHQEETLKPSFSLPNLEVGWYEESGAEMTVRMDLELHLWPVGEEIKGFCAYNRDLFEPETISRMMSHYENLLSAVVETPEEPISQLPLMKEAELEQILVEWNRIKTDYPNDKCIHELFEAQVEKTPDAIAVVFEEQKLTYSELNSKANQLAHYLQTLGVQPDVPVGICLERSLEMVIGILGILKAGGAYVPIDPSYPQERITYTIADAAVPVLLTQEGLVEGLQDRSQIICLDRAWSEISQQSSANPDSGVQPYHLSYVIYTSGSTGEPKGVMIQHENVTHLFSSTESWYSFNSQDVWTLFHSFAFDFSVWEIWGALLYGGRLVVVPYWVSRSPDAFYELLCQEQVTILNQTPSAFKQLIYFEQSQEYASNLSLRLVIFGGEALDFHSLKPWFDKHGDTLPQLVNMYGITETTVHVTHYPINSENLQEGTSSVIGRPIDNMQAYVLDKNRQLMPVGVAGELYISGAGLARGYLNRPELTQEKFIPHLFSQQQNARLYKTGDLARYLPDGNLEFLGRIDHQVKIRGYRIEIGEIEALLNSYPIVKETVVLVREDNPGDKRLVAYIVPQTKITSSSNPELSETQLESWQDILNQDENNPLSSQFRNQLILQLRQYLKERLPEYMVPSGLMVLSQMPLTPNGKIDRKALPVQDVASSVSMEYVAPETETQKLLAEIWAEVLGIEKVGIHDNFFEVGGHSLLATKVVSRVRNTFNLELSVTKLFTNPTIAQLAEVLVEQQLEQVNSNILEQILAEVE
ncbi:MAG: amino acid adenylation domain-containing protein [Okeania sp. SIO2C2]|uniref:non-ribosomal peptide synthetase n=1 Tax=Okeania sp. SIO2C2 TaxID=2607787 RepID=UPI0013B6C415|nr:amino acid adenylation domain-containing protein [Okeania sp. SIO2C2]NEP88101.1 amino acid adenylation domain-containing protein [Okeania sp. SIO2C2]